MKLKLYAIIFLISVSWIFIQTCFVYASSGVKDDIILQGFHWESHLASRWWDIINEKAGEISEAGFDMVWFPPSSAAASDEGYLPNRLYDQNSRYGSVEELKNSIRALHAHGIKAIADIVINHRVGTDGWADFTDPEWGPDSICSTDEWPFAQGNPDTGLNYHAGRDIDHTKDYVRASIIEWMNWLRSETGYDGWRYDFAAGYHGSFTGIYNMATVPYFSVGEVWPILDVNNPDYCNNTIIRWIDTTQATSTAFDYTTKGILQYALARGEFWRLKNRNGRMPGIAGVRPDVAVTFIDNHDTGPAPWNDSAGKELFDTVSLPNHKYGQNCWPFPHDKIMAGYAYILTHPGIPCVFWVHYFDWGYRKEIKELMSLRKSQGILSDSRVSIVEADNLRYVAEIDGKLIVRIGSGKWQPGSDWRSVVSGKEYVVWVKQ